MKRYTPSLVIILVGFLLATYAFKELDKPWNHFTGVKMSDKETFAPDNDPIYPHARPYRIVLWGGMLLSVSGLGLATYQFLRRRN